MRRAPISLGVPFNARLASRSGKGASVWTRAIDGFNREDLNGTAGRFKLQAELFFERGKNGHTRSWRRNVGWRPGELRNGRPLSNQC